MCSLGVFRARGSEQLAVPAAGPEESSVDTGLLSAKGLVPLALCSTANVLPLAPHRPCGTFLGAGCPKPIPTEVLRRDLDRELVLGHHLDAPAIVLRQIDFFDYSRSMYSRGDFSWTTYMFFNTVSMLPQLCFGSLIISILGRSV